MTNWIITSSALILIMIAARKLLKGHISPLLQYALWLIVLARLIIPFNPFESSFSVLNAVPQTLTAAEAAIGHTENTETEATLTLPTAITTEAALSDAPETTALVPAQSALPSLSFVLGTLWLTGIAGILIYAAIRNTRLARFLKRTRKPFIDGTYIAAALPSSCLFGIVKPSIYITEAVAYDPLALEHVLAHEQAHRRHGDHIWNLLRIGVLALHWYNPLVWWACALSKRDAEMAADASAIAALAPGERFNYGETLLNMLDCAATRDTWFSCSTTMITTKRALRERIEAIVKNARTAVSMAAVVLLTAIAVVGCTFTGAEDPAESNSGSSETTVNILDLWPTEREHVDIIARWTKEDHGFTHIDATDTLGEWISNSKVLEGVEITDYYMLEMHEGSMVGMISYNFSSSAYSGNDKVDQFLNEAAASIDLISVPLGTGYGTTYFAFDITQFSKYNEYYGKFIFRYLAETDPRVMDPVYIEPVLNYYLGEPSSSKELVNFYVKCVVEDYNLTYEDDSEQLLHWIHDAGYEADDTIDSYYMMKMSDGTYAGTIILDPSITSVPNELKQNSFVNGLDLIADMPMSINPNEIFFFLYPSDMPIEEVAFMKSYLLERSIDWANENGLYE